MKYILLFLLSLPAQAQLSDTYIEYKSMMGRNRHPLFVGDQTPSSYLAFNFKYTLPIDFYVRAKTDTYTMSSQHHTVSLNYETGNSLTNWLDLYYFHRSEHVLDAPYPHSPGYPLENGFGVRVFLKK